MNVTYIHHSSFLIETERCYYLFDYFQGSIPALNPSKPVLVLASHMRSSKSISEKCCKWVSS